jgi:cytidylate kinase
MPEPYSDDVEFSVTEQSEAPLHGYRGEVDEPPPSGVPAGLTIALSREAGARGATIAKRAGERLGWDVYSQEMMEYIGQDPTVRQDLLDCLTTAGHDWIDERVNQLLEEQNMSRHPSILELARLVLSLGAQGNVVLLGRGAGLILPSRSTLHVRLVAPLQDRVTYMSQWLRLTDEEAADQVHKRDHRRADFLSTHFHRKPNDVHVYDMVLNTSLLGEERSAELIVAAAKAKMSAVVGMD